MRICFATNNLHKLEEVRQAVTGSGLTILSLEDIHCSEELPETRDTIAGNSLQKAEYVYANYRVACFADDTGLEVDALNGAPGVYSARYAGPERKSDDNIELLLTNLRGKANRSACFRTVITLIGLDGAQSVLFEGIVKGTITETQKGTSGFGYDPVFMPDGFGRTFAEMTMADKNKLSHRAKAVSKLVEYLKAIF
ncbi:MAG: non-canonical purine NTP diphosphatase [Chryseolinea sp.]